MMSASASLASRILFRMPGLLLLLVAVLAIPMTAAEPVAEQVQALETVKDHLDLITADYESLHLKCDAVRHYLAAAANPGANPDFAAPANLQALRDSVGDLAEEYQADFEEEPEHRAADIAFLVDTQRKLGTQLGQGAAAKRATTASAPPPKRAAALPPDEDKSVREALAHFTNLLAAKHYHEAVVEMVAHGQDAHSAGEMARAEKEMATIASSIQRGFAAGAPLLIASAGGVVYVQTQKGILIRELTFTREQGAWKVSGYQSRSTPLAVLADQAASVDAAAALKKADQAGAEVHLTVADDAGVAGITVAAGKTLGLTIKGTVSDQGMALFPASIALTSLAVDGSLITDVGTQVFGHQTGLRNLRVHSDRITPAGLSWLVAAKDLEQIDLDGAGFTDALGPLLAGHPALHHVYLHGPGIGDAAAAWVGESPALTWLDLSRTAVTDATVALIVGLPKLKQLDLSDTSVGDDAALVIAGIPTLQTLRLERTKVGDRGLAALAEHKGLRRLYLRHTLVTEGARPLIPSLSHLERVDLRETGLNVELPAKP
jgi:hypothetical protein